MEGNSFVVDLRNLDDVRVKRDQAMVKVREAERAIERLRELERERDAWIATVAYFSTLLPPDPDSPAPGAQAAEDGTSQPRGTEARGPSVAELAADVVNRERRKIKSKDVCTALQNDGHDVTASSVSNALYYAANKAKTIKTAEGRGMYAPLDFTEPEDLDDA